MTPRGKSGTVSDMTNGRSAEFESAVLATTRRHGDALAATATTEAVVPLVAADLLLGVKIEEAYKVGHAAALAESQAFFAELDRESRRPSFGDQQSGWLKGLLIRAQERGLFVPETP